MEYHRWLRNTAAHGPEAPCYENTLITVVISNRRGDAGARCGGEGRQPNVGGAVLVCEDEVESVDLPRMRAAMTAQQQMGPATQTLGG